MRLLNPDFHKNINKQQCLFTNVRHNFMFYDQGQLHIETETHSLVLSSVSSCLVLYKIILIFHIVTLTWNRIPLLTKFKLIFYLALRKT